MTKVIDRVKLNTMRYSCLKSWKKVLVSVALKNSSANSIKSYAVPWLIHDHKTENQLFMDRL